MMDKKPLMPRAVEIDIFVGKNEAECIAWLLSKGVIYNEVTCDICLARMRLFIKSGIWKCPVSSCRWSVSVRRHSFFATIKTPLNRYLQACQMWANGASQGSIRSSLKMSKSTVCNLFTYCREAVSDALDEEDLMIGGPGVIVEIDETQVGRRKHNVGRIVEGFWAVGGIERSDRKRAFIVEVTDRSAATLIQVIRTYVREVSIIYTDGWSGYNAITRCLGFQHLTVNHSRNFVDPVTGCHTNTKEGLWSGLKRCVPARSRVREVVGPYLNEFLWRRLHRGKEWESFIEAIADIRFQ